MLLWLLACTSPPPEPDGPAVEPPRVEDSAAVSVATGDSGSDSGTVPALPIGEALDCPLPDKSDGPDASSGDLHRVTLPDALCNDGTPAVAFVRAALDPAHASDFVVQLDGGSYCDSGESCAERWCGAGPYDARDMSSSWQHPTKRLSGLSGARPDNAFAGWNQVYVPYCSSDMWMGQRRDVPVEADGVAFQVHFEGARIVDAVFDGLEAGLASEDGEEVLPPVADADRLLLAGASAGGLGVLFHLDAVAERLAPVEVTGLVDAIWSPDPAAVADAATLVGDVEHDAAYAEEMDAYRLYLYERVATELYDGRMEPSCVAALGSAVHRCLDPGELQRAHVATPFVLHHDVSDNQLASLHLDRGASLAAYRAGSIAGLAELASTRPDVGVLVSDCGKHTVIGANDWFLTMSMPTDAGPTTTHGGTVEQLEGSPVVTFADGSPSVCP